MVYFPIKLSTNLSKQQKSKGVKQIQLQIQNCSSTQISFKFIKSMDPKEFCNIKKFLSTPIKKTSFLSKQKCDSRPTYSQTSKSRAQKISSIFNRTFFVSMQNTRKGAISIKSNSKCKTQQSIIVEQTDNLTEKKKVNRQMSEPQKMVRQNTQPNGTLVFAQGVKTRSLTFEYYYKKIKRSQKYEKKNPIEQLNQGGPSVKITKQYATNLNQQMLESMKRYIKKGQKIAQIHGKYSGQTSPHYGLDIKAIQTKKPEYIDEELLNIKEMKKYSLSSLFVVKKSYRPTIIEDLQEGQKSNKNGVKDKRVAILEKMLCKKRKIQTETSPDKLQIQAQKSDEKTPTTRLQGMTMNLNLILSSFKCIWAKDNLSKTLCKSPKKGDKFTYFIGYGNNKNLIRSIMKKRWWWNEVYDINEANFIWTQLKVNDFLDQMESRCKKNKQALLNDSKIDENEQTLLETEKSTLETLNKVQICLKRKSKHLNNQYLDYLMRKQNIMKLNWIFHENTPVESIQVNTRDIEENPFNFSLISPPKVVHNHFRLNYMFGNKNALFHNLRAYFEFTKNEQTLYKFIPKTYYLQKENKVGIKEFHQREFLIPSLTSKEGKKGNNIWIVKPGQNSNRGQGISVHSSFESIKKQLTSSKKSGKFIVQSYLRNLFLYQKRKFDIRVYLLMIQIGPTTKYFWYNEGYIRTSSEYYNTNDIENIFIHLTNDAIQCDSEKYGKFQPGNKLSYSQFQRYLDTNYSKEKYSIEVLNDRMKEIATEAVRAIHPRVRAGTVEYGFELFGLDFLIDSSFNPWLLEINTNPCLQLACPVLQRLIPRMLQNMFRLSLDSIFQPHLQVSKASSYFIYDNIFDINRFELVFDSNYDENKEYMAYCLQKEEKVYADDNQLFENDGEEVNVEI